MVRRLNHYLLKTIGLQCKADLPKFKNNVSKQEEFSHFLIFLQAYELILVAMVFSSRATIPMAIWFSKYEVWPIVTCDNLGVSIMSTSNNEHYGCIVIYYA